jgi:hypothetical protein
MRSHSGDAKRTAARGWRDRQRRHGWQRGMAGNAGTAGTAGASGSAGAAGTGGGCSGPTGTTCATANDYCAGFAYAVGAKVLAMCIVNTGGCIANKEMLFNCVADCGSTTPGTGADQNKWTIAEQCN